MADYRHGPVCPVCGNDMWDFEKFIHTADRDIIGEVVRCTNCIERRIRKKRKPGVEKTPSQIKAINKILKYVRNETGIEELKSITEKKDEKYGWISFSIRNHGKMYGEYLYLHVFIGTRGGIEVSSYEDRWPGNITGAWNFMNKTGARPSKRFSKELTKESRRIRKEIKKDKK